MGEMRQIVWDQRRGAAENARRELPGLVSSYFSYVRGELANDPTPAALHRLRLATKRLRYTIELFRPCYGPGLETRLEVLRKVQQRLGDLNDCVAAWNLLSKAMSHSPQRARVGKFLDRQARRQADDFRKEWRKLFEAPGREEWWTGYLARQARVRAKVNETRGKSATGGIAASQTAAG
jgi:CHAD domain-containing protein